MHPDNAAIAYGRTEIRRLPAGVSFPDYVRATLEFQSQLDTALAGLLAAERRKRAEAIEKVAQVTQGGLNQFLATPIRSDKDDITLSLVESYAEVLRQARAGFEESGFGGWESRLVPDAVLLSAKSESAPAVKRLLTAGRRSLAARGVRVTASASDLVESVQLAKGMSMYEILERGLADAVATLAAGPRKLLRTVRILLRDTYEIVPLRGTVVPQQGTWHVALTAARMGDSTTESEETILAFAERLPEEFNLPTAALWIRHFAPMEEARYALRLSLVPEPKLLAEIIRYIGSIDAVAVRAAFLDNGAVTVCEITGPHGVL